ncbi:MAG TPA: transporter substrate-binding domain-containing protein [Chloroflexota bacterium]|jgi:polar amino acid transport system substrate-binding protein
MSVRPQRAMRAVVILIATNLAMLGLIVSQGAGIVGAQQSQSTLEQVVSRGSLRCGIPIGGLPVAAKDASGAIIGSVPDMCAEMAKGLGVNLDIVDTPTPDRIPFIQTSKIDVTIGTITLERAKAVGFSTPWVIDGTAVAFLNSSGITAYEQIHGKRLAVVTGATGDLVATSRFGDNDIARVDLASTAIQAVISGQADAVFDDFSTLSLAAADNPNLMVLTPLTREPSGVIVRLGDQQWTNWVNYFLDDYFSSGVSTCGCGKDMLRKWFKTEPLPLKFAY